MKKVSSISMGEKKAKMDADKYLSNESDYPSMVSPCTSRDANSLDEEVNNFFTYI